MRQVEPRLVVGVDPDKTRTALVWATRTTRRVYALRGLLGGGAARARVEWSSITGALAWLRATAAAEGVELSEVRVVVETQAARSPRSTDVEALRRVRYHWDAACELLGCECEHVDKAAWQTHVAPVAVRAGKGAIKQAYQDHARALLGDHVANEDQAAAFGILQWQVEARLGATLSTK